jgi:hypothetical protein
LQAGEGFTMKGPAGTTSIATRFNYVFKGLPNNGDIMLDLNKIYCSNDSREDMNAQNKVVEILRENAFNRFSITGITKGIKNVFRGFDTSGIKLIDTHPYHCFSVNIKLSYYLTEKCN